MGEVRIWGVGGLVVASVLALSGCAGGMSSQEQLPPEPAYRGFETTGFSQRESWPSTALHLTRDEIRGEVLSLLLREVDGLEIASPQLDGWGVYRAETAESARCPISLWIDGEWTGRVGRPDAPLDIDSAIPVELLLGLEVHLGMEGPVFDDQLCGAILAWTRETERWADLEFEGGINAEVYGAAADTVVGVRVDPIGDFVRLDGGGGARFRVLPGSYEVVFMTDEGPLARRTVRVHAYRDARIRLEVTENVAGDESETWRR